MAYNRHREDISADHIGTRTKVSDGSQVYQRRQYIDICDDVVGNRNAANPLGLESYDVSFKTIDAIGHNGWYTYQGMSANPFFVDEKVYEPIGIPQWQELCTLLRERTNPSNPAVDLPLFFAELRDFPRMIYLGGRSLIEKAASGNLAYHFGWKPFLGDLQKLLEFNRLVEVKMLELLALQENGLNRQINLRRGHHTKVDRGKTLLADIGLGVSYDVVTYFEYRCWGSIIWKPNFDYITDSEALRKKAHGIVSGISKGNLPVTAWNLIPWSWLLDWFVDIDGYLKATNNEVATVPENACVMRNTTIHSYLGNENCYLGNLTGTSGDGRATFNRKERFVCGTPVPVASLPFLTGRQWSILGSLAILRRAPRI